MYIADYCPIIADYCPIELRRVPPLCWCVRRWDALQRRKTQKTTVLLSQTTVLLVIDCCPINLQDSSLRRLLSSYRRLLSYKQSAQTAVLSIYRTAVCDIYMYIADYCPLIADYCRISPHTLVACVYTHTHTQTHIQQSAQTAVLSIDRTAVCDIYMYIADYCPLIS